MLFLQLCFVGEGFSEFFHGLKIDFQAQTFDFQSQKIFFLALKIDCSRWLAADHTEMAISFGLFLKKDSVQECASLEACGLPSGCGGTDDKLYFLIKPAEFLPFLPTFAHCSGRNPNYKR